MRFRQAWKGLSALALAVMVGAACTPTPAPAPSTGGAAPAATSAPKPFIFRIGGSSSTAALDPHASIASQRYNGMFESLLALDENGKVIPSLATAWKNVDATTWQFTLAQGRKFSDGNPVTMADVKYSWDRGLNPDNKLGILTRLPTVASTAVVDDRTFNVITKVADPLLLKRVALVVILEKAHIEKLTPGEIALQPIGTGPYMLKEFVPNDHYYLVPNPNSPIKPFASEIQIKAVPELAARVAGLKTSELDAIATVSLDQADALKAAGYQIAVFDQGRSQGAFLFTNVGDLPTNNKLVRQAMNYAIDKETLAKTVFKGFTKPEAGQIVESTTVGYNPNLKAYPYDPAKAKALLAQAGYPNGIKIKVDLAAFIVESQATWLYIQNQWKAVGIDADLNFISDSAGFLDRWYGRTARGSVLSVSLMNAPAMDADFALTWFRGNGPDANQRFYVNKDFDDAYTASTTELNEAKRSELLQKAMTIMYDDPPYLFLIEGFELWAISPDIIDFKPRGDQEALMDIIKHK
jgi:peptide/nickel transport system substrate-binding protein